MAHIIYGLCTLAAALCAGLLFRGYLRSRYRLLLWGGICFLELTLNNALLVADKLVFPDVNLFTWRLIMALGGMVAILYGIIWDAE